MVKGFLLLAAAFEAMQLWVIWKADEEKLAEKFAKKGKRIQLDKYRKYMMRYLFVIMIYDVVVALIALPRPQWYVLAVSLSIIPSLFFEFWLTKICALPPEEPRGLEELL